jgi:hypothetical protein
MSSKVIIIRRMFVLPTLAQDYPSVGASVPVSQILPKNLNL